MNKKHSDDILSQCHLTNIKLLIPLLCCQNSTSSLSYLPPSGPNCCTGLSSLQAELQAALQNNAVTSPRPP